MRRLVIGFLAWISLYGVCVRADRVSDYSEGLNSSDMLIAENWSALNTPLTSSFSHLFESLARKHNIQCRYDPHTNEVIKPPYPTLVCGPKGIPLVSLQPIWDRHYYVFQSAWFEEACKTDSAYTMKQLKAIADSFAADFKSALAGNARVAHITVGLQKDPDVSAPCAVRDVPADLVE
jgi:hypothetical protein